ncbi:MAG: hypothetical protein GY913_07165, partial [Proteobacteria bacterium]|nr:hypothetical protein [Pseudomonadota bacterium]
MSLTSVVNSSRPFFKQHVTRPAVRPSLPVRVPRTSDPSRMGSSIDYAMRYGCAAEFDTVSHRPTAHTALQRLAHALGPRSTTFRRTASEVRSAEALLSTLDSAEAFRPEHAEAALILGRMEVFARGGRHTLQYAHLLDDPPTNEQIAELMALYDLITWDALEPASLMALNPTFGDGSRWVGGADADL